MIKVSKFFLLTLVSFALLGVSDLFAFCLVTGQRDRVPICTTPTSCLRSTLRYKVEREYNALGDAATCTTGDHDTNYGDGDSDPYDDWLGFKQSILFATTEWGGWGVPDVAQIDLRGVVSFSNPDSDMTLVVGNWPQELPDPYDDVADFIYRDGYSVFEENYGSVTLNAASTTYFADDQSPFTCGSSTLVALRNLVIVTRNVTKSELFNRASCLRDGGAVYVCPGILRSSPWNEPDDLIDLTQFTQEQIAQAWCDQDADGSNTMENDCNDTDPAINPDATEICGNLVDENCNGELNEGCVCTPGDNQACGSDVGECRVGNQKCGGDGQWEECTDVGPSPEVCDGELDEDCDGEVDEGCLCVPGTAQVCGSDVGACEEGSQTCDMDGLGWGYCKGEVTPEVETCDGTVDEDCDGLIDEDCLCAPGATRACGSAVGACEEGIETCNADGLGWGSCTGGVTPAVEACDGTLDEDCDGSVDEGCFCVNGATRPCGATEVGDCAFGLQTCFAGGWGACAGAIEPSPEVCGGASDENCDGVVNDGCACVPGAERPCGESVGACEPGTETCAVDGLSWGSCTGGVGASAEVCDTLDNDCDGATDEDDAANPRTWYTDADGDAFGNLLVPILACNLPAGAVADSTDCNDANPLINPRAAEVCGNGIDDDCDGIADETPTWYEDADGDSYGNAAVTIDACLQPGGFVANDDDCDDTSGSVNPGAVDICEDGVDQDCSGTDAICPLPVDTDNDGDGFCVDVDGSGTCDMGGTVGDCNDNNAAINPSAVEMCDGVDNNCNGLIDEASAADATTWYIDVDGDSYGNPAFSIISCSRLLRFVPDFTDCNDSSAGINPGALEVCGDAVDQDCSGADLPCIPTADTDDDGDGFCEDANGDGICTDGARVRDCDDTNAAIHPDAAEICDGIDNNCDRIVDIVLADDDGDSYFSSCPRDCVDSDGTINPAAVEVCGDGLDNNCDGMDVACPEEPDEPDPVEPEDKDEDGFTIDFDCNDLNKNVNPNASEICDGIDNNCDGLIDFADPDGDGFLGPCPIDCNNADETIYPGAMEICDDEVDNDCNNVIDEGCPDLPTLDCTNQSYALGHPTDCPVATPGETPVEPTLPDPQIIPPGGFPGAITGGAAAGCGLTAPAGAPNLSLLLLGLVPLVIWGRKRAFR